MNQEQSTWNELANLDDATRFHRSGQLGRAEQMYRAILAHQPEHPQTLSGLGACLAQRGQTLEAIELLERAAARTPGVNGAFALANLGNALQAAGLLERALNAFEQALRWLPENPDLHVNLGNLLRLLGRSDDAMTSYEQALKAAPNHGPAHIARGVLRTELGQMQEALADFDRALSVAPGHPVAQYNRGVALQRVERHEESVQAFEQSLRLQPGNADAQYNLGLARKALGQQRDALQDLDRAVALRPSDPRFYATRGHLLQELKEYAAALTSYELSLAIRPDGGVLRARADALRNLLRFEEAADAYQRALAFAPNDPESAKAHVNWATCLLLLGKFAPGWEHMEWRWGDPAIHPPHPYPLDRLWIGEHDPAGRTLLVHSEQGYGDTLQFCRYASLLAARSVRVVLLVPPALETLLHSLGGVSSLVTATNAQTAYDLHTPLLSLPLALGTRLEDVPAKVPYLHASDARRRIWGHTLGPATKPRIGLVWAGNPAHGNDANRSMPLANLEALVAEFGSRFEWISLQREVHIADQGAIVRLGLHDFGARLRDFADTAALMAHLDLVISVDTAAAHLAGALARPVWIMLPFVPDWRWMLERTGSPWYPTARLFRQRRPGDWDAVVSELASGLREFLESTRRVLY